MLLPSAFRALAESFIPEIAGADPNSWRQVEDIVSNAIKDRPPAVQRQILAFIRILDGIALVRHGSRLAALHPVKRTRLIEGIGASRLLLLRRGVWGLRTLVQMGWYCQPAVQEALGYRATAAGWAARR